MYFSSKNTKIVVFGTGSVSKVFCSFFRYNIDYFIDNDDKKWGKEFLNRPIRSPNILSEEIAHHKIVIFIASSFYSQIAGQLHRMGLKKDKHYYNAQEILGFEESKSQINNQFLTKNKLFKDIHKNKRCFIIANGPSINDQNLLLLKDDLKIVVNSFHHHSQIDILNPNYWVIADPAYWVSPDFTIRPMIKKMKQKELMTRIFMPDNMANIMAKINYGLNIEPHLFKYKKSEIISEDIDFSEEIPRLAQNVVCVAIMLGLFLGCNKIYLLGCDHSWWGWSRETYIEDSNNMKHFYKKGANERTMADDFAFEDLAKTIKVQKQQYEELNRYGINKEQIIYNATRGGYLEIFSRVEYESLFY